MAKRPDPEEMELRELDGHIAESLFCRKVIWKDEDPFQVDDDPETGISLEYDVPHFSSHIADAWHVLERISDNGMTVQIRATADQAEVEISGGPLEEPVRAADPSAPRALAVASLQLGLDCKGSAPGSPLLKR